MEEQEITLGEEKQTKKLVKLPEQKKAVKYLKEYVVVFVAALLQAIALHTFIQPNDFSPGGFFGIATFIEYMTGGSFNAGLAFFFINIPLIIWASFKFKKDFLIKTTVTIILNAVILYLMPLIGFPTLEVDPSNGMGYAFILCSVVGGILCGISLGLLLRVDGCNGGTEVVSAIIQKKYPATNISWFIFALDSSSVILSAFFFDASKFGGYVVIPMILSIVKMFCSSKAAETLVRGASSAIKFEVVTLHGQELGKELTTELKRGVTIINARGAYSGNENQLLICIVRKRQMAKFKRILSRYPDTFAYVVPASEVYGIGFTHNAKEGEKETVI
ncbi:MAG: YitT family protein [Clostridia bacterium]|nr:YitT family protein [Clostridia bacterium]